MRCERGRLFVENDAPEWWKAGEYVNCFRQGTNAGCIVCMHLSKFKPGSCRISDGLSIQATKLFITGRYIVEKTDGESIVLFLEHDDSAERIREAQERAEQYTKDIGVKLDSKVEKEAFLKKLIWETYKGIISPGIIKALSAPLCYLIDNHDIIHRKEDPAGEIDYKTELEKLVRSPETSDSAKLNAIRDLIKRGDAGGEDNAEKRVRRRVLIENDNGD